MIVFSLGFLNGNSIDTIMRDQVNVSSFYDNNKQYGDGTVITFLKCKYIFILHHTCMMSAFFNSSRSYYNFLNFIHFLIKTDYMINSSTKLQFNA